MLPEESGVQNIHTLWSDSTKPFPLSIEIVSNKIMCPYDILYSKVAGTSVWILVSHEVERSLVICFNGWDEFRHMSYGALPRNRSTCISPSAQDVGE